VRLGQALAQQLTPELAREHLQRLGERRDIVVKEMQVQLERDLEEKKEMTRFLERLERARSKES
jgi:hypothetical protein